MTEDEALTKWCPFARLLPLRPKDNGDISVNGLTPPVFNRALNADAGAYVPAGAACIASACMAWRWRPQHGLVRPTTTLDRQPFETDRPQDYEGSDQWKVERLTQHGFCGLAGAPQ